MKYRIRKKDGKWKVTRGPFVSAEFATWQLAMIAIDLAEVCRAA